MIHFSESDWKVDPKDFKKDNTRSSDKGHNNVSFVTQKSTGHKCVLHKTNDLLSYESVKTSYDTSKYILATVDHRAIVPFVGFYELNNYGYIITEKIENGDLQSLLNTLRKGNKIPLWDNTHKLIISYGIANAIKYLHERQILHRDIRPCNILLNSELHPYLFNFNNAKKIDGNSDIPKISISQALPANHMPTHMAPEYLGDPDACSESLPIDVYSYGITLYEIITELVPYPNFRKSYQLISAILSGERPSIPDSVPSHWKQLIEACWNGHPDDRPTFARICEILESDMFVNDSIDRQAFEDYKELLQHPRTQRTKTVELQNS